GSSISLYPAATRRELIRLLAVFLAYALARNNCCSAAALRRLNVALVVNGCLLALFAIVQFLSSPRNTVYWSIKTQGTVFGPFLSETHFPAYVNICIGAALGLLLADAAGDPKQRRQGPAFGAVASLLNDPRKFWLGCALALMGGAVALSLSRGG